jgi:hypothetical protein
VRYDEAIGKYNVDVIPFPSWRVWFFEDDEKYNVIHRWLDDHDASGPDRSAFQALLDICEFSGPDALAYCAVDLGDNFYGLSSNRKGGLDFCAVFCRGPFSDSEITFLAAALWIENELKPHYVKGIAEENLAMLIREPGRRQREPIG